MNVAWWASGSLWENDGVGADEVGQVHRVWKCHLDPTGAGATTQRRFLNRGEHKQDSVSGTVWWLPRRLSHCWCLGLCAIPPASQAFLRGLLAHSTFCHEKQSPWFACHTGSSCDPCLPLEPPRPLPLAGPQALACRWSPGPGTRPLFTSSPGVHVLSPKMLSFPTVCSHSPRFLVPRTVSGPCGRSGVC